MRRTDPSNPETGQTTTRFQPHRVTTESVKLPAPWPAAFALSLLLALTQIYGYLVDTRAGWLDRTMVIVPMTVAAYILTSWVSRLVRWHKQR